jgi:hypothetical protein
VDGWSSGFRKRSPGSVEYYRQATVRAIILTHVKCQRVILIQYKANDVFRLRRLSTVYFVFVFLLSNDVRH